MPREHQALSLFWYKHDPGLTLQLSWHRLNLTHLEQWKCKNHQFLIQSGKRNRWFQKRSSHPLQMHPYIWELSVPKVGKLKPLLYIQLKKLKLLGLSWKPALKGLFGILNWHLKQERKLPWSSLWPGKLRNTEGKEFPLCWSISSVPGLGHEVACQACKPGRWLCHPSAKEQNITGLLG